MLLRNIRDYMRQHADSEYKWHMVGCDVCGVYPIVGRRFQCLDCPETIGYDLCGSCQDNSAACSSRGRFNQNHTAEHRMQKCEPQLDWSVVDLLTDSAALTGLINCLQVSGRLVGLDALCAVLQDMQRLASCCFRTLSRSPTAYLPACLPACAGCAP